MNMRVPTGFLMAVLCACGAETSNPAPPQTPVQAAAQAPDQVVISDPQAPCMEAHLTGVGGPAPQPGKAQSGVFIRYGTVETGCDGIRLQFDAGRGTLMRLAQIPAKTPPRFITPQSLDALFITHAHSDHTSSLPDIISTRWVLSKNDGQFSTSPPPPGRYSPLPVICFGVSCEPVSKATAMWDSHEIPGRAKNDFRTTRPEADIREFTLSDTSQMVWQRGAITVSAITVDHIEDSVGFKIETPAGDVCISGDTDLSENLISACDGVDVLIHETVHPVLAAIADAPPEAADPRFVEIVDNVYKSHTDTSVLSAFDGSVSALVMTHMTPGVGAGGFQGIALPPYLNKLDPTRSNGPLRSDDFCSVLRGGGYEGVAHLGVDRLSIRLEDGTASFQAPDNALTDCDAILAE